MDVGVRELKAKLSSFLQRAASGEVITVTDRGRPVAVLGPPMTAVDLATAVDAGWVTPAKTKGLRSAPRHKSAGSIAHALAEDRGE